MLSHVIILVTFYILPSNVKIVNLTSILQLEYSMEFKFIKVTSEF